MANFRIVKKDKGFIVEVEKSKWTLFGLKKYWTHYVSVSGIESEAWHHSSYDNAMMNLIRTVEDSVRDNNDRLE